MPEVPTHWDYSKAEQVNLREGGFFEEPTPEHPSGMYAGRRIITRDTPINKGVYPVGGRGGEALVIDDEKYPEEYDRSYQRMMDALKGGSENKGLTLRALALNTVFEVVKQILKYDSQQTEAIIAKLTKNQKNKKIALNVFIQQGVGVCRHQAVLAAYLLERLKRQGVITGKISVDRNYVRGKGGHAWVRYTNSQGEVFIIDPAQDYIGPLSDITTDRWFYERPEDLAIPDDNTYTQG